MNLRERERGSDTERVTERESDTERVTETEREQTGRKRQERTDRNEAATHNYIESTHKRVN